MDGAAVEVSTTARLHLGFLDPDGSLGRRFGSVGMLLDGPRTRLRLWRDDADSAEGPDAARGLAMVRRLADALGLPGQYRLTVADAVPPHAGLGSGTQMALAAASALRHLHGLDPDPRADAAILGRGRRSGVGIGLFSQGGLVVDGGPSPSGALPPVLVRLPVPDSWRVILVTQRASEGLSGAQEVAAFAALPPMPEALVGLMCRLVLMQLLPAVAEADLPRFGDALTRMQVILGDYFAPAQGGGRFTSATVGAAVAALGAGGAVGLGQTSWGPTGFAFVDGADEADELAAVARADPRGRGLDFTVCRTLNRGASVTLTAAN